MYHISSNSLGPEHLCADAHAIRGIHLAANAIRDVLSQCGSDMLLSFFLPSSYNSMLRYKTFRLFLVLITVILFLYQRLTYIQSVFI